MTTCICFDLDNTLYDHQQFVAGAYSDIAKEIGARFGISSEDFYGNIFAKWKKNTSRCTYVFSEALKENDIYSPQIEMELVRLYRDHLPTLELYPNVMCGLKKLVKSGCSLGLLTDGQSHTQRRKIEALKIKDFFSAIVVTGDWGRECYKPHPRGFLELANILDVAPSSLLYVGDNPDTDFETPKKLGMETVRIVAGEYKEVVHPPSWVDNAFTTTEEAINWMLCERGLLKVER